MTVCACCSVAFEWAFFIHLVRGIGLTSVLLEYLNGKKLMYIYSH
jgi:AAA+ ATPase superfamily predicted ATPase